MTGKAHKNESGQEEAEKNMYRRYYSYNDMPSVAKPLPAETGAVAAECKKSSEKKSAENPLFQNGKLFGQFEMDDVILLVVVFILLMDDCDDKLLLLALAFIFFNS